MTPKEITDTLDTLEILVDRREQDTPRANRRYNAFGVPYERCTLNYGDYTYNLTIDGQKLYDTSKTVRPSVIVERKMDLNELSQCLCQSRKRFAAEFERAKQENCKIYLLIENGSIGDVLHGRYDTRFGSSAFAASLFSFMARYNINVVFCDQVDTGKIIYGILYREAKERITNEQPNVDL